MIKRIALAVFLFLLISAAVVSFDRKGAREVAADPQTPDGFASPINGGCYITAPGVCKIHVDPFIININDGAGAKLERFTILANSSPVYDFRTDAFNPPGVDYSPSLVAGDFIAECGETYFLNLIAKDTTDGAPLNYGQTGQFTCPTTVP